MKISNWINGINVKTGRRNCFDLSEFTNLGGDITINGRSKINIINTIEQANIVFNEKY